MLMAVGREKITLLEDERKNFLKNLKVRRFNVSEERETGEKQCFVNSGNTTNQKLSKN